MGGIGRNLAQKVRAFGMRVQYHNRTELGAEMARGARYVAFEELLRTSDVISLNLPLNVSFFFSPFFSLLLLPCSLKPRRYPPGISPSHLTPSHPTTPHFTLSNPNSHFPHTAVNTPPPLHPTIQPHEARRHPDQHGSRRHFGRRGAGGGAGFGTGGFGGVGCV